MTSHARSTPVIALVTMCAFASNSVLCRLALLPNLIDPAMFTAIRLASGALMLVILLTIRRNTDWRVPHWGAALALAAYAAPFSFAYVRIPVGVGAFVLFAAVQLTMIGWDIMQGRRVTMYEWCGLALALTGLVLLTLPGAQSADIPGVLLMAVAGGAWGVYSILGRGSRNPLGNTGSNFAFSLVFAIPLLAMSTPSSLSSDGLGLAIASGALASGLGYVLWYTVLPRITTTQAAILQMMVPVLASFGGAAFLNEQLTARMIMAGAAILTGIFLAVVLPAYRKTEVTALVNDSSEDKTLS